MRVSNFVQGALCLTFQGFFNYPVAPIGSALG